MRGIILLLAGATAFAQQISFTSQVYVLSPVAITDIEVSAEFGFDSVSLRNDAAQAISAVHFLVTFRSEAGEEPAEERRVTVSIGPRETRSFPISLGHLEGLKQLARTRRQTTALAILTVESVEFADGSEWKQSERDHGAPIDPVIKPADLPKK